MKYVVMVRGYTIWTKNAKYANLLCDLAFDNNELFSMFMI